MKNNSDKNKRLLNMKILRGLGLILILFDYIGDTLNFYNFFAKPLVSWTLYKVGGLGWIVLLLFFMECIYLVGRYILKVRIDWNKVVESEKDSIINKLLIEKIQEESNFVYNILNSFILPHLYLKLRVLLFRIHDVLVYIKEKYCYVNIY